MALWMSGDDNPSMTEVASAYNIPKRDNLRHKGTMACVGGICTCARDSFNEELLPKGYNAYLNQLDKDQYVAPPFDVVEASQRALSATNADKLRSDAKAAAEHHLAEQDLKHAKQCWSRSGGLCTCPAPGEGIEERDGQLFYRNMAELGKRTFPELRACTCPGQGCAMHTPKVPGTLKDKAKALGLIGLSDQEVVPSRSQIQAKINDLKARKWDMERGIDKIESEIHGLEWAIGERK